MGYVGLAKRSEVKSNEHEMQHLYIRQHSPAVLEHGEMKSYLEASMEVSVLRGQRQAPRIQPLEKPRCGYGANTSAMKKLPCARATHGCRGIFCVISLRRKWVRR